MKIKQKMVKKNLLEQIQECRKRTGAVITELRNVTDFSQINNAMIARLNDVAFKAVNNSSLQKMLDKRAVGNEDLYKKLDKEVEDLTKKMDFKKLAEQHK